jgi:hypothetical protein
MTGPVRATPGEATPGENAQDSEDASPLAWQGELDTAIADIDSRLSHPRRRATDAQASPQLGRPEITSELIDEIAWRVAETLRQNGNVPPQGEAVAEAISRAVAAPPPIERRAPRRPAAPAPPAPAPPMPEPRALPHGVAVTIRIRKPLFRFWPFRRRRQAMILFSDYRI